MSPPMIPYPERDPWEGTDEEENDCCHHGRGFDEECEDCDEESAEEDTP